jgi:phospholipid-transporting ATPase
MALVIVSIICMYALGYNRESDFPYIFTDGAGSASVLPLWLELYFVFFLLFNNFIPISLYVTIELVNLGQAYFVSQDVDLFYEPLNMACSVRSSNLVQELGLVRAVFSDKTGTLTRNEMKFVQFYVDNKAYSIGNDTELLMNDMRTCEPRDEHMLYCFLQCLATCHTVVREKNGTYRAESPDELALVEGIQSYECGLIERGTTSMICNIIGERQRFDILAVNAFNSRRKRMSVLLKDPQTGLFVLMCKGADNMMLPLCQLSASARSEIDKALLDYSCLGLRTLCVSRRVLDPLVAEEWLQKYKAASSSLDDREKNLERVGGEIEVNMELLGVTAVEDKLQDEVPEVIADLAKAGIVLWMLTGDKEETAINIGHSCNLLQADTQTFFLTRIENAADFETRVDEVSNAVASASQENADRNGGSGGGEIALVLDGDSFKFFDEQSSEQRRKLLEIGKSCRSVIACRLTPDQKKQLVSLVKVDTVPRATTLAIGDGANDVSMIMEADVGVGIFGKEGRQAANNSDFAIGQFKYLRKLLLVHGRWNYCRQSKVFLYSMHKNMVLTLSLFWFR